MSTSNSFIDRIERRREAVFSLHFVKGMSISRVAELLSVHRDVVSSDIDALKASASNSFRESSLLDILSTDVAVLEHLRVAAIEEFERCVDGLAKNEFLKTAIMATDCRQHMMGAIFTLLSRDEDSQGEDEDREYPTESTDESPSADIGRPSND